MAKHVLSKGYLLSRALGSKYFYWANTRIWDDREIMELLLRYLTTVTAVCN